LDKVAEQRRKLAEEMARLEAIRVNSYSGLEGLTSAALLDQIRAFKLIDKVRLCAHQ
jgi:hypothetical protein